MDREINLGHGLYADEKGLLKFKREPWMMSDEIMVNERYDKFRKLAKELVNEARRINLERTVVFFGMSWDFEAAHKFKSNPSAPTKESEVS